MMKNRVKRSNVRAETASGRKTANEGRSGMAVDRRRGGKFAGGIGVGGILVIVGIIVALFWSLILGIIIAVVGLIAFGGFVSGKWY
jgi:hypothetical protein